MSSVIAEILIQVAIEVCIWIALLILWVMLFPVACMIVTPFFLLFAFCSRRPFREAIADGASGFVARHRAAAAEWEAQTKRPNHRM
jgi:hypothetical protein